MPSTSVSADRYQTDTTTTTVALLDVDLGDLSPVELDEFIAALDDAPVEIREQFEDEFNVFSGAVDSYIPLGSNVTVAERRTIVAITASVASPLSPLSPTRRRKA